MIYIIYYFINEQRRELEHKEILFDEIMHTQLIHQFAEYFIIIYDSKARLIIMMNNIILKTKDQSSFNNGILDCHPDTCLSEFNGFCLHLEHSKLVYVLSILYDMSVNNNRALTRIVIINIVPGYMRMTVQIM